MATPTAPEAAQHALRLFRDLLDGKKPTLPAVTPGDTTMGFLSSSTPAMPVVPPVPPAATQQTMANPTTGSAMAQNQQRKAAAGAGADFAGTLTNTGGATGLTPGPGAVTGRALLG